MNQEDWVSLPSILKEKYQPISGFSSSEHYLIVLEKLKEYDTMPIEFIDSNTSAYKVFTEEYNSILLTAHLFENLLMLEDIRHEESGHNWFQIEIPMEYFRYPAFNNIRSSSEPFSSYKEITEEEKNILFKAVKTSKNRMNYSNDENIAKENLHKLEFLSMFSFLEAYLENILVEKLGYNEKDASKEIRYNSVDKVLKNIIDKTNPTISILMNELKDNFFGFIKLCYLIRNLHTHNLGRVNKKFIDIAIKENLLYRDYGIKENGEKIFFLYYRINFSPHKIVKLNRYITISEISHEFRNYIRECLFMIESNFNKT